MPSLLRWRGGRQVQYQQSAVASSRFWGLDNLLPATLSPEYIRVRISIAFFFLLHIIAIFIWLLIIDNTYVQAENELGEKYKSYQQYIKSASSAFQKNDYPSAITNYSKAIELSPFEASSYYQRGIAFYKLGKFKDAISDFDRVIILDARMNTAYTYRGLCRVNAGEYKEALSDYKKALEFNPKDVSVHNNLALVYAAAKDEKVQDKIKALEHGVRAAELSNEKNAEVLDTLALVYFVNGKIQEAVEAQKKALKLEPNNEKFKENLKRYEGAAEKKGG